MDIVYLHDLKLNCIIGIWEWEHHTRQTILLDLDLAVDIHKAAQRDHIDDTVNYKAVAKRLKAYVENTPFKLVETLAERVATLILQEFPVQWLRLKVNKQGAIDGASAVGVIIERSSTVSAS
ncbi:MAG: dihydroneopterin aldolase [Gammaproteobacteria bacterium]|nr:dihydroneopterin aldolase [Gammaproteobacteria bacterium]